MRNFYLFISFTFLALLGISVFAGMFQSKLVYPNPNYSLYMIQAITIILLFIPLSSLSLLAVVDAERE